VNRYSAEKISQKKNPEVLKETTVIQTYRIFFADPSKPAMSYVGLVFGDGISADSRVDDELSHKPPNKDFAAAVIEHGRYAFDWEILGNYDTLLDALKAEAEQIEHFMSWHPDHGWNKTRGIDKKRLARAEREYCPGATIEAQLDAAIVDFRNNAQADWSPYDSPENENILRDIATKERCSIFTAFAIALKAGPLKPVR
jgi:hypothetical protein